MGHPRLASVLAVLVVFGTLLFGAATPAWAWDPEADRAVALLAYERLSPPAKAAVDALLQGGVAIAGCQVSAIDDDARLADCLHGGKADFMHDVAFDALPLCPDPSTQPPCKGDRCASAVLAHEIAVLKDPAASREAKALALEATAYLMAEIHQPLHAADNNDHSGDRVRVMLQGTPKARVTLYSVWDNDLVASAIGTAEDGLPYLRALADAHGAAWSQGDVAGWIAQTHDVALHVTYGALAAPPACGKTPAQPERLGASYFAVAVPAVREQLAKAGVRLATVLNAALS
jgi:hypothetical protein